LIHKNLSCILQYKENDNKWNPVMDLAGKEEKTINFTVFEPVSTNLVVQLMM